MKKILFGMLAGTLVLGLAAAAALRAEPAKDTKDAKEAGLVWTMDYKAAVAQAKKEKKMLLLDFTGSDWCGYCIKLHNTVFSTPEFAKWANEKFVLVELDFPHKKVLADDVKKQNAELNKKYAIEGYPTIIILDAEEKTLSTAVGYGGDEAKAWMKDRETEIAASQKK